MIHLMIFLFCSLLHADGLSDLQTIMEHDWAANIQQQDVDTGDIQKGKIQASAKHKCVRIDMGGYVYLYTKGGLHMKNEKDGWTYTPLPSDLAELWTNPVDLLKSKKAQLAQLDDGSHVVYVNSDGRFVQLFWNNKRINSWIVGSVQSGQLMNEAVVTLDNWNTSPKARPDEDWHPQSDFALGG